MKARLLVVEDDNALRQALQHTLECAGFDVTVAADAELALKELSQYPAQVLISDVQMPGMDGFELLKTVNSRYPALPVILITAYATVQKAVTAIRQGAVDYLVKPFDIQTLVEKIRSVLVVPAPEGDSIPIAEAASSVHVLSLARQVASTDVSVLITGESGVGKEVIARFIHACSTRRDAPFVAINCAAIPENMLEATLFGYEKGAFTGAYQSHAGKFEQAQGGTLLLDEITEMDMNLQAKLLRVLQEREVERLGGRKTVSLDVRVLATSNRHVKETVQQGRFRADLYYRLNVFPLALPALRERKDDIIPLAQALLQKHASLQRRVAPQIEPAALAKLTTYHWPGNIRELENCLQRALILAPSGNIAAQHVQFELFGQLASSGLAPADVPHTDGELKQHETNLIVQTLHECMGSRKMAAEKLGISPRTLRYKLAKLREQGMDVPEI